MKTTMSFTEYDILADRLSKNNFKCGPWWPTVEEIQTMIEPNLNKYLEFLIWILETAEKPETEEQKESKKYINKLLIKSLKLTDNTPPSVLAQIEALEEAMRNDDGDEIYEG